MSNRCARREVLFRPQGGRRLATEFAKYVMNNQILIELHSSMAANLNMEVSLSMEGNPREGSSTIELAVSTLQEDYQVCLS